jgi:hypothetical protein
VRRQPRAAGHGTLDVLVSPWARVKIDGREVGLTPLRTYRLSAGRHWLELRNRELNRALRIKVEVRPGGHKVIRRDWD